jgi:hypothetical protein
MVYPRKCPGCHVMTPENGFHRDLSQPSGRKSRCRSCHRRAVQTYHDAVRKPRRQAVREAERAAEREALEKEHRKRVAATNKLHAAQVRRQKEFLRSIGVPDVSPGEVSERVRRRPSRKLSGSGSSRSPTRRV